MKKIIIFVVGLFLATSTNPCGEIPLCPYDSCRLLAVNLYSYVVNPFRKDAYFDFDLFKKHVALAQKIMDDIIDLELEKIQLILKKIEADPEDEEIKRTERELWKRRLKSSRRIQFKAYPKLNHLFMEGSGMSLPAEYMAAKTIPDYVINDIVKFINHETIGQ